MDWTDDDPSLDTILESVTLCWLTGCASSNIWSYRQYYGPNANSHGSKKLYINKPFGYAWFPKEPSTFAQSVDRNDGQSGLLQAA